MPKQNIVLDATMLSSLMSCGRMTDLRHNHLFVSSGGKSNSLETGSIVHEVMETYYKGIINGLTRNNAIAHALAAGELYVRGCPGCALIESGETQCGHAPGKYPGVMNTPIETTSSPSRIGWKNALDTCEQYFEYYKNDIWVPLEVEKVLSKILYEDDNIRILWKAKVDLLTDTNRGIYSCDHKTHKQRRETTGLNNQFIGQALVTERRGVWINKIGFQSTLKPEEKFTRVFLNFTADRLLEWQSEILPYWGYKLVEYNESGYWPPNYTHCDNKFGMCVYKDVCEADRNIREETIRVNFIKGPEWNPTNDD